MNRKICALFLACMMFIAGMAFPAAVQADNNKIYYDQDAYYNTLMDTINHTFLDSEKGLWNTYFTNTNIHAFVLLRDKLEGEQWAIDMAAALLNDSNPFGSKKDVYVEYYQSAILSLLETMENEVTTNPEAHMTVDRTMKLQDYIMEGIEVGLELADVAELADFGDTPESALLGNYLLTMGSVGEDIVNQLLIMGENTSSARDIKRELTVYHNCLELLSLFEKSDDQYLVEAAQNIKDIIIVGFESRWDNVLENDIKNYTVFGIKDVFKFVVNKYDSFNNLKVPQKKLESFLNRYNALNTGIDLGKTVLDFSGFKTSDLIFRYYEALAMSSAQEAVLKECSKLVEKGIDTLADCEQFKQYLSYLLYINARGNYCMKALSENGWLAKITVKNGDEWYRSINSIFTSAKINTDCMIPDLSDYQLSYEEWQAIYVTPKTINIEESIIDIGYTVTFGTYEQDCNTANGSEPIEWRIIGKDGNKALLITSKTIDVKAFNELYEKTCWRDSSLRAWLNGIGDNNFFECAFSEKEQNSIVETTIETNAYPDFYKKNNEHIYTNDKVFILSIEEAYSHFANEDEMKCTTTPYVQKKNGFGWWWLRSFGSDVNTAAVVTNTGSLQRWGDDVSNWLIGVRPCIWVDTTETYFKFMDNDHDNAPETNSDQGERKEVFYVYGGNISKDGEMITFEGNFADSSSTSFEKIHKKESYRLADDCQYLYTAAGSDRVTGYTNLDKILNAPKEAEIDPIGSIYELSLFINDGILYKIQIPCA